MRQYWVRRLANETSEDREKRLTLQYIRSARWRAGLTQEKLDEIKLADRLKKRAAYRADPRLANQNRKLRNIKRRNRDYKSFLVHGAARRAKKRGIEFSITVDDLHWPLFCPVLGIRLDYPTGEDLGRRWLNDCSPSLDRWDNSLGYIPGNVYIVSWRANRLKADGVPDDLLRVALYASAGSNLRSLIAAAMQF